MGYAWTAVVFVGAFVLFGTVAWARWRNRGASAASKRRTEQGTRDLYRELNAEDRGNTP